MPPITVRQPNFLDRLARASENQDLYDVDAILQRLQGCEPLLDIADSLNLLPDEDEKQHLAIDWYGGEQSWWPGEPVADKVRAGYIRLLQAVKAQPQGKKLPIEGFWIERSERWEVVVHVGKRQITMFIFTTPRQRRTQDPDDFESRPK